MNNIGKEIMTTIYEIEEKIKKYNTITFVSNGLLVMVNSIRYNKGLDCIELYYNKQHIGILDTQLSTIEELTSSGYRLI